MTRVIVDAANDPSNNAFVLPTMQRGIDCRTSSQIGKIRLGEGPPPPIAIDPAKYLLLNDLLHFDASVPARKNTTFFLQDKGVPEEGGTGLIRTHWLSRAEEIGSGGVLGLSRGHVQCRSPP